LRAATLLPTVTPSAQIPDPGVAMVPVEVVTPDGAPVTLTAMAALKVVVRMVVAQVVPLFPGATLSAVGARVSEKLGAGSTLMATSAVLVTPPPVAVRVAA
jgi:hypothetical protein